MGALAVDNFFAPREAWAATPRVHAIRGARIVVAPGKVLENATVVLRDGLIQGVGPGIPVPPDARVWEAESLTVYAGLIEPYLRRSKLRGEQPAPPPPSPTQPPPDEPIAPGAVSSNPRVHPEFVLTDRLTISDKAWKEYHALGLAAAYVVPDSGIFRGRGALLSLRSGRAGELEITPPQIQCLAYERAPFAIYPTSLMGVVALMRQTFLDAGHHRDELRIFTARPTGSERPAGNRSLESLTPVLDGTEPILIETSDVLSTLRSDQLAREMNVKAILRGSGEEYKRLDEVRTLNRPLILPIAFPDAPELEREEDAWDVSLRTLRDWDRAPSNPSKLEQAGVPFAVTTDGLKEPSLFWPKIRAALARGLSREAALRALTTEPARILGVEDRLGTIEPGKIANLVVTDGDLFEQSTHVRQVWVDGEPIEIALDAKEREDVRGLWRLEVRTAGEATLSRGGSIAPGVGGAARNLPRLSWLEIQGKSDSLSAIWSSPEAGDRSFPAESVRAGHDTLQISWPHGGPTAKPPSRLFLRGALLAEKSGYVYAATGDSLPVWAVRRRGPPAEKKRESLPEPETPSSVVAGPLTDSPSVLVRHATIWTCTQQHVLPDADLLLRNGKIEAVDPGVSAPDGALIVDATGLHLTPGIMDCHSHTATVGGVNEISHSSTAEVRIQDILDSEDLNLYRQLAGGVTTIHILHGSANPIGGQDAVIKLRWGSVPEGLRFAAAPPGIKFALGENVTQKSWGDQYTKRYPKTRMGVEQFIRDRFLAARDYEAAWSRYHALSGGQRERTAPPRRDLELEALLEVLQGRRFVHCHAYRQDEILMLIRLAESFGFRIQTFQHVLEGYKVGREIQAHGAGASAFSDAWSFKPETVDGIPYIGALLYQRGVITTYNSDNNERARWLNLEAAKAVKYGEVPEEEALKFVTTHVARQLGVLDQVGTLEPGKDADFALWSGSPLSTGSICLQTWVDGKKYFDRELDLANRPKLEAERAALLAKAKRSLSAHEGDGPRQGPPIPKEGEEEADFQCLPREANGDEAW